MRREMRKQPELVALKLGKSKKRKRKKKSVSWTFADKFTHEREIRKLFRLILRVFVEIKI